MQDTLPCDASLSRPLSCGVTARALRRGKYSCDGCGVVLGVAAELSYIDKWG